MSISAKHGSVNSNSVHVKKGQDIHLSLFDPAMPGIELGGERTAAQMLKPLCQCTARVRDVDGEGLVVDLPSCDQARECIQESRMLYALLDDVGRNTFATQVMALGDTLTAADGMVRLQHPTEVKSCQRRDNFRTKIFPNRHCFAYAWPIKTIANAEDAVQAYLRGDAWDDERLSPFSRERGGRSVLLDMSLRGVGLALGVGEACPTPTMDSLMLLRLHLDDAERPVVCPVRVRWTKAMSKQVIHVGAEMLLTRHPRLATLIDNQVGRWLADMQRVNLSAKHINGVACRSLCRDD